MPGFWSISRSDPHRAGRELRVFGGVLGRIARDQETDHRRRDGEHELREVLVRRWGSIP
jgi:hypothetical protein